MRTSARGVNSDVLRLVLFHEMYTLLETQGSQFPFQRLLSQKLARGAPNDLTSASPHLSTLTSHMWSVQS